MYTASSYACWQHGPTCEARLGADSLTLVQRLTHFKTLGLACVKVTSATNKSTTYACALANLTKGIFLPLQGCVMYVHVDRFGVAMF